MLGAESPQQVASFEGISTDSRKPTDNTLFFALSGPNFDAHDVLDRQVDLPVSGLVVSRSVAHPAPQILVDNPRQALGRLAAAWRQQFQGCVIALTGSNGKTSVKELLAAIFRQGGDIVATHGNLNNDIGLPLTLLRIRPGHEVAVVEMGADHAGEIDYLTHLAQPDIALVNNAGPAHLSGFGDLEGVARAKGEIFSGLGAEGVAVINADDAYCDYWARLNQHRKIVFFGQSPKADAQVVRLDPLQMRLNGQLFDVPLRLKGRHNAMNAAAAAAAALAAKVPGEQIVAGLASALPVPGRLRAQPGMNESLLVDDSYNANPASVQAAIDWLATQTSRQVLILGDMAELGEQSERLHATVGKAARDAGIDCLFSVGPLSVAAASHFGPGASHYESMDQLINAVQSIIQPGDTVLVKGSRSAGMERVVSALQSDHELTEGGKAHVG